MSGFKLVHVCKFNGSVPIFKYQSRLSGIKIYFAEITGDAVRAKINIALQSLTEPGLPYIIENLITHGCENYPYSGILDAIDRKCLSSKAKLEINDDHTVYSIATAEAETFLKILPIYLEHILYPTLTDDAFINEIHHIDGEGFDAGDVYKKLEMDETREQTLPMRELQFTVNPWKYGVISEGVLPYLRQYVTNSMVRAYHARHYKPDKISIVITGNIRHADVFEALLELEENIVVKGDYSPGPRSWLTSLPPVLNTVKDVVYPSQNEEEGVVYVAWRGPSVATDRPRDMAGCTILMKYLTEPIFSPLYRALIDTEEPLAKTLQITITENRSTLLCMSFTGVPVTNITLVRDDLLNIIGGLYVCKHIDLKRIRALINMQVLDAYGAYASEPHDAVAVLLTADALYGSSSKDLERRLDLVGIYKSLLRESDSFWRNLILRYLLDAPVVILNGIPSATKESEMMESERIRITEQIERLGDRGLELKFQELQRAITIDEAPIPREILDAIPSRPTRSVKFLATVSCSYGAGGPEFVVETTRMPLYTYLDTTKARFTYILVVFNTMTVSRSLRPYLAIIVRTMTDCPAVRHGRILSHHKLMEGLEKEYFDNRGGVFPPEDRNPNAVDKAAKILVQLELDNYSKGVRWIYDIIYHTVLTVERLKIIVVKMMNEITLRQRNPVVVARRLIRGAGFCEERDEYGTPLSVQYRFLEGILERLNRMETRESVVLDLELIRRSMVAPENMSIFISMNLEKLTTEVPDVYRPWKIFERNATNDAGSRMGQQRDAMGFPEEDSKQRSVIGFVGTDTSNFIQSVKGYADYEHMDLPAVLVCLQYLMQTEQPPWRTTRGRGRSYNCRIFGKTSDGGLYMTMQGARGIAKTYRETKALIEEQLKENSWQTRLFQNDNAYLIFDKIGRSPRIHRGYDCPATDPIGRLRLEELRRIARTHLPRLFDPSQTITTFIRNPQRTVGTADEFQHLDYELKVLKHPSRPTDQND